VIQGSTTKAAAEEIGHFDEEGSPVTAEARLELIGKGTEAVAIDIAVVSNMESRPRIRRPAKKKLPLDVRGDRIKVDPPARKNESRELISSAHRNDVLVKGQQMRVVPAQTLLGKTQREIQRRGRLISDARIHVKEFSGTRIQRRVADWDWRSSRARVGRSRRLRSGLSLTEGEAFS